ncbi:hypothetical protein FOC1_g10007984 [Fusarium oxysporum f. sp. cubense race 1]|uniref:Uncharacterized protein n=1 Tax=Fusarium oxysporum f. sp. cubense (strain race 1) TaxID=1229664 RepID=N4TMC2_FUSC1|nr:hypothetical protein FOC1_g10007984 [Fusarium oxysporum f. sp. cubense race 1]
MEANSSEMIRELHGDLQLKWEAHGPKVETAWRLFNKAQRAKCMKAGSADGVVLKHSSDVSLGNTYKFIPEWNLADITEPNSDFLLDILKHRATKTLFEQYAEGVSGTLGDRHLIEKMVREKNLRHVDPFKHSYTYFYDEKYGESFTVQTKHLDEVMKGLRIAVDHGVLIPQSLGELVLQRQIDILQLLNVMIEDILDQGSQTRNRDGPKKQFKNAPLSESASKQATVKFTPQEVAAIASDQKSSLEEYLSLLRTEPTVLCPGVNVQFFSRPELVPDEKGRSLPVHTDKSVHSFPSASRKKGNLLVTDLQEVDTELNQIKKEVDLRDYAAPIDNLLEPGMSAKALEALDDKVAFIPIDTTPVDAKERIETRRQKEKTRPEHSSLYAITPITDSLGDKEATKSAQPVKVSSSTAEVFATLFDKTQSRGSVNWSSFEAAMSELGFSVLPRFGSVYTFRPSEDMDIKRPVSIHRPHQSQIEGYLILILARRLNRAYGWSEDSFVTE